MYSRLRQWLRVALGSLTVALFCAGCSWPWGNRHLRDDGLMGVSQTQCLAQAPRTWQRYFSGDGQAAQINQFWGCVDHALGLYTTFVKGNAGHGAYTAGSIRAFLEKTFLGGLEISDPLLGSAMKLKRALMGGSDRVVTRKELEYIRSVLPVLRKQSLALMPYIPVLLEQEKPSQLFDPLDQVEAANLALENASHALIKILPKNRGNLAENQIQILLEQLQKIYDERGGWQGPNRLLHYLPLENQLRKDILASPGNTILASDWEGMIRLGVRIHQETLRYDYLLKPGISWRSGTGFQVLSQFGFEVLALFKRAAENHPNHMISFVELHELIHVLAQYKLLPFGLTEKTFHSVVAPIALRYLRVPGAPAPDPDHLTLTEINEAEKVFRDWFDTQRYIIERTNSQDLNPIELASTRSWRRFYKMVWNSNWRTNPGVLEMRYLLHLHWRFLLDKDGRLAMTPANPRTPYDLTSLSQLNWERLFIRQVNRGYAQDPNRAQTLAGLNRHEFHQFYKDIAVLGNNLKILDPRNTDIWSSVFGEGRIFTFTSDADLADSAATRTPTISYESGVWLVAYAMSTRAINHMAWDTMVAEAKSMEANSAQKLVGPPDLFGDPMLEKSVFEKLLIRHFQTFYSNMPGLIQYESELARESVPAVPGSITPIESFIRDSERAAKSSSEPDVGDYITASDFSHMTMLYHYVESIFLRFDQNGDGILSPSEVQQMYPILAQTLSEVTGRQWSWLNRNLLAYLAAHGNVPGLTDGRRFESLMALSRWISADCWSGYTSGFDFGHGIWNGLLHGVTNGFNGQICEEGMNFHAKRLQLIDILALLR